MSLEIEFYNFAVHRLLMQHRKIDAEEAKIKARKSIIRGLG